MSQFSPKVIEMVDQIATLVSASATCGYDTVRQVSKLTREVYAVVGPGPDMPVLRHMIMEQTVSLAMTLGANTDKAVEFCKAVAHLHGVPL